MTMNKLFATALVTGFLATSMAFAEDSVTPPASENGAVKEQLKAEKANIKAEHEKLQADRKKLREDRKAARAARKAKRLAKKNQK